MALSWFQKSKKKTVLENIQQNYRKAELGTYEKTTKDFTAAADVLNSDPGAKYKQICSLR